MIRQSPPRLLVLFTVLLAVVTGILLAEFPQSTAAGPVTVASHQPPPDDDIEDFMQSKLAAINAAMESAATDDYQAVQKAGMDLIQLSKQVAWRQRASAAYLQDTADFVQSAEFMIRMAEAEDSLGVASSYGAVAASCLDCHRHIRTPKIAATDAAHSRSLVMSDFRSN